MTSFIRFQGAQGPVDDSGAFDARARERWWAARVGHVHLLGAGCAGDGHACPLMEDDYPLLTFLMEDDNPLMTADDR